MKRMPGESCGKDSSKVSKAHCVLDKMLALFARVAQDISTGTQFTCFTSTKVQILTPEELLQHEEAVDFERQVLSLLALLVQKCKY